MAELKWMLRQLNVCQNTAQFVSVELLRCPEHENLGICKMLYL